MTDAEQADAKNMLTATPKTFLQHSTDNRKVLAAGEEAGGVVVLKANGALASLYISLRAP